MQHKALIEVAGWLPVGILTGAVLYVATGGAGTRADRLPLLALCVAAGIGLAFLLATHHFGFADILRPVAEAG